MGDVAIVSDKARVRLAKMALAEDGLAMLYFRYTLSLIEGGVGLIGNAMPRETFRFDLFNLGFLQLALIGAAFFGIARARSKFVVPRTGFVIRKRPRWSIFTSAAAFVAPLLMLAIDRDQITKFTIRDSGAALALPLAAMCLIAGLRAKLPRMTCLGVFLVIVGAWGYERQVSYQLVTTVLGLAVTIACLLQFRSYLKTHLIPEPEHA